MTAQTMDWKRCLPTVLLLCFVTLPAAGRVDVDTLCAPWREVPVPDADIGDAAPGCETSLLYFGADGTGGDPVAARHCAYADRAGGGRTVFGGSAMLMMLYANGEGVARDLRLARRFVCEHDGAPAEVRGRLDHLQRIDDGADSAHFDVCDDITSGYMAGFCVGRAAGFARASRERTWQALQSDWTPAQLDAWRALRAAADGYFDHADRDEIDLSGTARAAFSNQARERLEIELLEDVQRFERGARPAQTAAALAPLDRELNVVYWNVRAWLQPQASPPAYSVFGTVTADGVRDTQRSWLRYREAWVAFAATRWPDTAGDVWRAWLTDTRTAALEAIKGGP